VAAGLAGGEPLAKAVEIAKNYLCETLQLSYAFRSSGADIVHALNQGTIFPKNEA
jgi:hydroxymethylpyrimidine/phosphomethylpyrimidine kinase